MARIKSWKLNPSADIGNKPLKTVYKQILQVSSSGEIADLSGSGTGVYLPGDGNINIIGIISSSGDIYTDGSVHAQQYIVSSSVTSMSIAQASGSTVFGDSDNDTHKFVGSITASGNISSSGIAQANTGSFNILQLDKYNQGVGSNTSTVFGNEVGEVGADVTAIGSAAVYKNTGAGNAAVGHQAMGQGDVSTGTYNAALGYRALYGGPSMGSYNIGVGRNAGAGVQGDDNVYLGAEAGINGGSQTNAFANDSIFVGKYAGNLVVDLTHNITGSIYIGTYASSSRGSVDNEIVIGSGSKGKGSNTVTIGNTSIVSNTFSGHITASGNISGSQTYFGKNMVLGSDTAPDTNILLHIRKGNAGDVQANSYSGFCLENNNNNFIQLLSPNSSPEGILFGDSDDNDVGYILYTNNGDYLDFKVGGNTEVLKIYSSGSAFNSHITASGNISASGTIISSKLDLIGTVDAPQLKLSGTTSDSVNIGTGATGGSLHIRPSTTGGDVTVFSSTNTGQSTFYLWAHSSGYHREFVITGLDSKTWVNLNNRGTNFISGSVTISGSANKSVTLSGQGHITASGNISGSSSTTASFATARFGNNAANGLYKTHGAMTVANDRPLWFGSPSDATFGGGIRYSTSNYEAFSINAVNTLTKIKIGVGYDLRTGQGDGGNEHSAPQLVVENAGIDVTGHITASGNISASGALKGSSIVIDARDSGDVSSITTVNSGLAITANNTSLWKTSAGALTLEGKTGVNLNEDGSTIFEIADDRKVKIYNTSPGLFVDTHITASGDISASGNIYSAQFYDDGATIPDYVFEPQYILKTLPEVEQHITEYKHLPGVPSADNDDWSQLTMADRDMKLLEKVEELTLYIIDLQKQIDELKKDRG